MWLLHRRAEKETLNYGELLHGGEGRPGLGVEEAPETPINPVNQCKPVERHEPQEPFCL